VADLSSSDMEKIQLEHQAAKLFMRAYERETGREIRHLWHNQPVRPDVSCMLEGSKLDIEVAHLYGSEEEAMNILRRPLSEETRAALEEQSREQNTNHRLLSALNRILAQKATKSYKSQRVWLLIRNAHPQWNAHAIRHLRRHICVPRHHPFEQIWILGDFEGKSGIVRLDTDA